MPATAVRLPATGHTSKRRLRNEEGMARQARGRADGAGPRQAPRGSGWLPRFACKDSGRRKLEDAMMPVAEFLTKPGPNCHAMPAKPSRTKAPRTQGARAWTFSMQPLLPSAKP
jgi:hypothetical protein